MTKEEMEYLAALCAEATCCYDEEHDWDSALFNLQAELERILEKYEIPIPQLTPACFECGDRDCRCSDFVEEECL